MAVDYLSLIEEANDFLSHLRDNEDPLEINIETREVIVPINFNKQIAMTNDRNSEVVTFKCPRYIEGYDIYDKLSDKMMLCFIKWENADDLESYYEIDYSEENLYLNDDNTFSFKWVIDKNVTSKEGTLKFSVQFVEYDTTGSEAKTIYCWQTKICSELIIGQSIYVQDIDTQEVITPPEVFIDDIENSIHTGLTDQEESLTLNISTRDLSTPDDFSTILCQNDCASMMITIELEEFPVIYNDEEPACFVKWENSYTTGYEQLTVKREEGLIKLLWVVGRKPLEYVGKLDFQILFVHIATEETNNTNIRWHSKICSILKVEDSIDCWEIDRDPFDTVSVEYYVKVVEKNGKKWLQIRKKPSTEV